jgi:NAD(P)-dependent dehydrogenase (short-subunit alcohol dehydrogenase family)
MTLDEVDAVVDVHLKGAFYVSHPAFKVMKENGYGRFVHTSSASGIFGNFGQANYGAAKAGLVGLSNVLAIEGEKHGIRSNAIAPTARTRMTEDLLGPFADKFDPDQVTPMVVYLCSEVNEYTHQVFSVGGGRYARIFIGTNKGWFAGQNIVPSVEDLAANMETVRDINEYEIPLNNNDELMMLAQILAS